MQIERLRTHKLFYNKWTYKVECRLSHANRIIRFGIPRTLAWCGGDNSDSFLWKGSDRKHVEKFTHALIPLMEKEIRIRAEGSHLNIFGNDPAILKTILKDLDEWVVRVHEPATQEEREFLTSTSRKIICDNLPKSGYQYRMYIKTGMTYEDRKSFYSWTQRYTNKFDISKTTEYWLSGYKGYAIAPFLYIKDGPTLSMTGLYLGNHVKKIEEFIPRTKINT